MRAKRYLNSRLMAVFIAAGTLAFSPCALAARQWEPGPAPSRFAISRRDVWLAVAAFLKEEGWKDEAIPRSSDLQFPSGLIAKENDPALKAMALRLDPFSHDLQMYVRCQSESVCHKFMVRIPARAFAPHAAAAPGSRAVRLFTDNRSESLVRPGATALLTMESGNIRLTLPVICLQRGVLMQKINVRDPESRKILQATVVGAGRLRTAF